MSIIHYTRRNFIFIIIFLVIVFLEVFGFNNNFFVNTLFNLHEKEYEINDGILYGFKETNGYLISEHNDPNITFRQIDDRVRYITINCTNQNPDALSQVFYRRENEDWTEENSLSFPLLQYETTISLPRIIKLTSLRFDLTNTKGDKLFCDQITINPKSPIDISYIRLVLLIFSIIGLFIGHKIIPQKYLSIFRVLLINNSILILIIIILLIDLTYPVTLTFDSAHYLWLTDIIRKGNWSRWDPIRYIGFPFIIFLSTTIFSINQQALLYLMIIAHILLFYFSCKILFDVPIIQKEKDCFIISIFIFLFIAMDPTIFGYFHTLLTEFLAATIAVISCYIGIKLYNSSLFSKRFFAFSSLYIILVPVAWHIKQSYIGASYFPLLIVSLLIILRQISWKTLSYSFGIHLLLISIVLVSTWGWNAFLRSEDNPMRPERQISTALGEKLDYQKSTAKKSPLGYLKTKVVDFLALSNYYIFDFQSNSVVKSPSIGRGNENSVIAHRMFKNPRNANLISSSSI